PRPPSYNRPMLPLVLTFALLGLQHAPARDVTDPALRMPYAAFITLYRAHAVVVVDTRDRASYDMGHIPGARLIPADDIARHVRELRAAKKPIVTYCS
ncbi:MAG TPA: rhodanese-like domain-containing protein, partial [Vicinamibacterales bacterium]|nr:rhodanese-like domain-containing protein [Vicinamibacterales bacterium]